MLNHLLLRPIGRIDYLASLVAGGIMVFAFAPFNIYPFAWLSVAILFVLLARAGTRKQSFLTGLLFGIGLFGAGASWPFYSMYYFAYSPLLLALLGSALFVLFVSLFSTGLLGLISWSFQRFSLTSKFVLIYPALWVAIEWLRNWLFTGFPWLYIGSSHIDSLYAAYAPIGGVFLVSLSITLSIGLLLNLLLNKTRQQRLISILLIISIVTISRLLNTIEWTQYDGTKLTASLIQANIPQEEKFLPEKLQPTIDLYTTLTHQNNKSDIIVWPETALPDMLAQHIDSLLEPLQAFTQEHNNSLLIGGFYQNSEGGVENSALAINAQGRELYSKQHLVPFGEYIPLLSYLRWLDQWIQLPYDNIAKGQDKDILNIAAQPAHISICYEDAFGYEVIKSLPQAKLLINLTNDGWFTGSLEPYQHMQIARMRSLETGRYQLRATNTGPSGIIDHKGKLIHTAPIYTTAVINGDVQIRSGKTPYVIWGDWLAIIFILCLLLLAKLISSRNNR